MGVGAKLPQDDDVVKILEFRGLRNTISSESFDLGDLEAAENVDLDNALNLRRRKGFGPAIVGGSHHSLYANDDVMVAMSGTTLCRRLVNGAGTVLRAGLTGDRLAYASYGLRIYYSDGLNTGCVDAGTPRTWGIQPPSAQPVAAIIGGSLLPGTYQYAVRYMRADGQPSGTGAAGQITLPATGGIAFSAMPVSSDPTVDRKQLFVSPVDGDKLYLVGTFPNAATTASCFASVTSTLILDTQFMGPPCAGQQLEAGLGHVFVARGRKLHWTPAYTPELMDLRRGFAMPSTITLIAAVDDGLWLGTAKEIIFLPGSDPTKFEYRPKQRYGAIAGAVARTSASAFDSTWDGPAVVVGTTEGVCACLNGGKIINLTRERFRYPITDRGAGVVRGRGGMDQYLMVLEGNSIAGNTAL